MADMGYVYVWDDVNKVWVKLAVNADGEILITSS